jgi:hypothetical protein
VIASEGSFEIRRYASVVVAETEAAGGREEGENESFRRLYRYISGENAARQEVAMTAPVLEEPTGGAGGGEGGSAQSREAESHEIAMTAPVLQERTADGWRMAFILPESFTIASAPEPTDPAVRLREIPGRLVASVRFSGSRSEGKCRAQADRLAVWIAANGYRAVGAPIHAGYDPPFTIPFLRRNEVLVEVEPLPAP